jgi:hypothetical protein
MLVPLTFALKDNTQILVKALLGLSGNSSEYTIVEKSLPLSKFYAFVPSQNRPPSDFVQFSTGVEAAGLNDWLQQRFSGGPFDFSREVTFLGGQRAVSFRLERERVTAKQLTIKASSLEVAQEIVQEYCSYFKVTELDSRASFINDRSYLVSLVRQVSQLEETNRNLIVGMAENVQIVMAKIVQAEDCRIQRNL